MKQITFYVKVYKVSLNPITAPGYVNLDFADVKTVMENQGTALMGIGVASGEDRVVEATKKAFLHCLKHLLMERNKYFLTSQAVWI